MHFYRTSRDGQLCVKRVDARQNDRVETYFVDRGQTRRSTDDTRQRVVTRAREIDCAAARRIDRDGTADATCTQRAVGQGGDPAIAGEIDGFGDRKAIQIERTAVANVGCTRYIAQRVDAPNS